MNCELLYVLFTEDFPDPEVIRSLSKGSMTVLDEVVRRLVTLSLDKGEFERVELILALSHFFQEEKYSSSIPFFNV